MALGAVLTIGRIGVLAVAMGTGMVLTPTIAAADD